MKLAARFTLLSVMGLLIQLSAVDAQEPKLQTLRERVESEGLVTVRPLNRTRSPSPLAVAESEMESQFSVAHAVRDVLMVTFIDGSGERIANGTLLSAQGVIVGKASLFARDQGEFSGSLAGGSIRCQVIARDEASDLIFLQADANLWHEVFEEIDGQPGKFVTCGDEIGVISVGLREIPQIDNDPNEGRLDRFHERMKVRLSERHRGFPAVLEMDLPIAPEDCGAPVIGLHGELIGIAIARSGLHSSYITPMAEIRRVIPQ